MNQFVDDRGLPYQVGHVYSAYGLIFEVLDMSESRMNILCTNDNLTPSDRGRRLMYFMVSGWKYIHKSIPTDNESAVKLLRRD